MKNPRRTVDTIAPAIRAAASEVHCALLLAAYGAICSSTVEAKILLGRHLHLLALALQRLETRSKDLLLGNDLVAGVEPSPTEMFPTASAGQGVLSLLRMLEQMYGNFSHEHRLTHSAALDQILDEPTTQAFRDIDKCMTDMKHALHAFFSSPAASLEQTHSLAIFATELSGLPGRDSRFLVGNSRNACPGVEVSNTRAAQFHGMLMSIEIPTIEACAENLLTASRMPIEFFVDMGRQAYDEARHAQALVHWLEANDVALGSFYISFDLWQLTRNRTLLDRLCIHQRLGETIGASAARWWSERFRETGEVDESDMYDLMYRDEIQHVAIGNRWIRHLCGNDDDLVARNVEKALAARQDFNSAQGVVNGQRVYPLPIEDLHAAGFSGAEIAAMAAGA